MPLTDSRPMTSADLRPAWALLEQVFGGPPHPEDLDVELGVVDPSRMRVVHDGRMLVGCAGSFAFDLTVPGPRTLPLGGVTWVGVAPTHRRRGVMSSMVTGLLRDLREEGRPLAALWASEAAIYQRFGFGPATWRVDLHVPSGGRLLADVPQGGLRTTAADDPALQAVEEAVTAGMPGWFRRDAAWRRYRTYDPEHRRDGAGPLRAVVVDGPDGPLG